MPAKSKSQQRFMGMVHAYQKGELKDAPKSVKKAAGSMTKKASKDFAKTKHEGLPEKVSEAVSKKWKEERLQGCKCPTARRSNPKCPVHGKSINEEDDVDFYTDKNWRDRYGRHEERDTFGPGFANRSLTELKQELEDLEREHADAVLMGEDPEVLDDLENQIEQVQAWIEDKERASVNVREAFKSLSFSKFLQIDEQQTPTQRPDEELKLRHLIAQLAQMVEQEMKAAEQPRQSRQPRQQQQTLQQQQRQQRRPAKKKTMAGLEKSIRRAKEFGGPVRTEGVLQGTTPSKARIAGGLLKQFPGAAMQAVGQKIQQAAAASPFSQVFKSAADRYAERLATARAAKTGPVLTPAQQKQVAPATPVPAPAEMMPDASALQAARGAARRPTQTTSQQITKPSLSPSADARTAQMKQVAPQQSASSTIQGLAQQIAMARNIPNYNTAINTAIEAIARTKPAVAQRVRQLLQAELVRGAKA